LFVGDGMRQRHPVPRSEGKAIAFGTCDRGTAGK
jgi:hypothetical protein